MENKLICPTCKNEVNHDSAKIINHIHREIICPCGQEISFLQYVTPEEIKILLLKNGQICEKHNKPIVAYLNVVLDGQFLCLCQECIDSRPKPIKLVPCKKCGTKPCVNLYMSMIECKICDPDVFLNAAKEFIIADSTLEDRAREWNDANR